MATIIDSLLVTLGIEGTQFRRGMDDATRQRQRFDTANTRGNADRERQERTLDTAQRRRQKEQDSRVKATVEGYRKIRNELLSLAAVFTAGVGIKDFFTKVIGDAANLGYLSKNLSMTTQQLTAFQRASERAGGSGEGIIAQLKESADALAQLKSGMGPNEGMQKFFQWGGNKEDLKDGNTYLLARSRIIKKMFDTDPAQAALIAKQMGIAEDQFNFLKMGPEAVMELVRAQEKNSAITERDAEAALKLKNRMLDLRDSLQATATRIVLQLAPTIELLIGKLEQGAQWVVAHKDDIGKWVGESIKWFGRAIETIDRLTTKYDNFFNSPLWNFASARIALPFQIAGKAIEFVISGIEKISSLISKTEFGSGLVAFFNQMLGGTNKQSQTTSATPAKLSSKEELKAEAARQWAAAGLAPKGGDSRGIRNNNPGNIEFGAFTKARGALGSDGRFAKFGTPEQGIGAMADLLRGYGSEGRNTVDSILAKYAPGNENNTAAYSAMVSKQLGVRGSDKLNLNDPTVMKNLVAAMIQHENGKNPYSDDVLRAATMSNAQKMANANAAGGLPAGANASMGNSSTRTSTTTNDVRIEKIEVHTQAKDADAIAVAMRPAVQKNMFVNQAMTGLD